MVIQRTFCIFLVIFTLNKAFAYKVALKTEQNVFEKLFENMDKEQLRIIFLSENTNGVLGQNHELHHKKPYAFMGHGSSICFRNALIPKEDDISSHVYTFINNMPHLKKIHYDNTIYKKSNDKDLSTCDQIKYDDEKDSKIGEMTGANTKAIRSTIGKSISNYTRYNIFCFRTEKKLRAAKCFVQPST
jgi:hypothetical protein